MQRCFYVCKSANHFINRTGLILRRDRYSSARVPFLSAEQLWPCRRRTTRIHCSVPAQTISSQSVLDAVQGFLGPLSKAPVVPPPPPIVIVISGPSGVGKDAVIKALQASRPDLHFVITATSRPQRPGEVHGVDYLFVTREEFEAWIRDGRLLEHALVYGEYKGIPIDQVQGALEKGTDVVLRLDIQGAATIRRLLPSAVSIFLAARSEEELVRRLIDRKTEHLDKMLVRVETAREENLHMHEFDYVVVNKDRGLEEAVKEIEAIIASEKLRVSRLFKQQGGPASIDELAP
eukprot:jgi/Botrbrau1/1993/Bobra.0052s0035.1